VWVGKKVVKLSYQLKLSSFLVTLREDKNSSALISIIEVGNRTPRLSTHL
jgi:hypothetical protein